MYRCFWGNYSWQLDCFLISLLQATVDRSSRLSKKQHNRIGDGSSKKNNNGDNDSDDDNDDAGNGNNGDDDRPPGAGEGHEK